MSSETVFSIIGIVISAIRVSVSAWRASECIDQKWQLYFSIVGKFLNITFANALSLQWRQVVDEKLEDGQLDESALTFGDLTRVKQALVDALISHYRHRIVYSSCSTRKRQPISLGCVIQ